MATLSVEITDSTGISFGTMARRLMLALQEGGIDDVINNFHDEFLFRDNALDLGFVDKPQLAQFFQLRWQLFPEVRYSLGRSRTSKGSVFLEWNLSGAVLQPAYGSQLFRHRVHTNGVSIIDFADGRVKQWIEYYDSLTAMRGALETRFKEYNEI